MELSLSSQFNTRAPIDLGLFVESHESMSPWLISYPNRVFILEVVPLTKSSGIDFWNRMMCSFADNTISFAWICYIAYFYQNLRQLNWTPDYIALGPRLAKLDEEILKEVSSSVNALTRGLRSLFFNRDTLFALIKPIHRTAVAIMTLSIHLCVFETGIKVVAVGIFI
jgi:hypothetical protein